MKHTYTCLVFMTLLVRVTYVQACDISDCTSVQKYRNNKLNPKQGKDQSCKPTIIIDDSNTGLNNLHTSLLNISNAPNTEKNKFYKCVSNTLKSMDQKRESDFKTIVEELKKIKLTKKQQINLLNEVLTKENSFYNYFKSKYKKYKTPYSHFTYTGPALELYIALTGELKEGKVIKQIYKRSGFEILEGKKNPIKYLLSQMKKTKKYIEAMPLKHNFSPGISKIALFEIIRRYYINNNKMDGFTKFAKKIKIGMKLPSSEFATDNLRKLLQYTTNDGYFFSSKENHINLSENNQMTSFDCTSFIQYCAFGKGSFDDRIKIKDVREGKFKMVTSDFIGVFKKIKPGNEREKGTFPNIQKKFSLTELKCENQLKPGDIIVYKGHILIFNGYQLNADGKIIFTTIEASGNENRSIGDFERNIYNEDCSEFLWKRDKKYKKKAYIVRFK